MTDVQSQATQIEYPEGTPDWAKPLFDKLAEANQMNKQLEAQREEYLAQRSQSQQGSNEGVIHLSFGDIPNTAENRQMEAAYGQDTAHLKPYDPIAEIRATPEGEARWARIREAYAAYIAERDQHMNELTDEEKAVKTERRERMGKIMGMTNDPETVWK